MEKLSKEIQDLAYEVATLPSRKCTHGKICDILFKSHQDTMTDAMLADLVDALPILGSVSNVSRIMESQKGRYAYNKRLAMRTFDLAGDIVGGGLIDLLLPTNTILFLEGKK